MPAVRPSHPRNDQSPGDECLDDMPATAPAGVDLLRPDEVRGRGARSNRVGRYEAEVRVEFDDGWGSIDDLPAIRTQVRHEVARSIISTNDSPDLSFDQSINPYRGCEHGCVYCYARPTHCYLGHSAGLDFETLLYAKTNAAEVLERELARPGYAPKTIALGAVTDPYQPVERELRITRAILEVLERTAHPVEVAVSVTTLDRKLARSMEPRAATPPRRLEAIRGLSEAGVPVTVMVAPIVPALTDSEIEAIIEAAAEAGAKDAGYVLLRLPLELKSLFREWLATDHPGRAAHVVSLLGSMHGGRDYVSEFGHRQRGSGPYAEQIAIRFRMAMRRNGLTRASGGLRTDLFRRPVAAGGQLSLL